MLQQTPNPPGAREHSNNSQKNMLVSDTVTGTFRCDNGSPLWNGAEGSFSCPQTHRPPQCQVHRVTAWFSTDGDQPPVTAAAAAPETFLQLPFSSSAALRQAPACKA